jgi:TolB-like protein/AraC-like DNA-binding protein
MTEPASMDQLFVRNLTAIVLDNLQNENFGVSDLARESGISRSVIHRRLRKIKNQNISQFIREIRLNRAMELLQQHAGTASEIAYQVGFRSPAYFTKCFHDQFGNPPGAYARSAIPGEMLPASDEHAITETIHAPEQKSGTGSKRLSFSRNSVILISLLTLFALVWVLYLQYPSGAKSSGDQIPTFSVIVLPFKNFSDDPANQYFADGIMEDILNHLYQVSGLRVISRTTSEHFRETNLTIGEIARKVNVNNVLEGSVRRYGDKTRVTVQLIDANNDHHLWSANYDRDYVDILGIQGDIAMQVALKLNALLSDMELELIKKLPTQNPEAYDYYLKGRFLLHKANNDQRADIDRRGLMNSLRYFEKAISLDPSYADAYAGLANAYFNLSAWGWMQRDIGFNKSRELCIKATEIDPSCAEAYAVKGALHVWAERRFDEGKKEMIRALQLNPNFPILHQWYTQLLMITGPVEEARTFMDRSLELEPYFWVLHNLNAFLCYFEGKHQEAIDACRIAEDLNPEYLFTHWLYFLNYIKLGKGRKAAEQLQLILQKDPGNPHDPEEIMKAFENSGTNGLLLWLTDININKPVNIAGMNGHPFFISWWFAIAGNPEESLYWLQRNLEGSAPLYVYFNLIATNPDFNLLRKEPRFLAIVEQIGLTPYHSRADN